MKYFIDCEEVTENEFDERLEGAVDVEVDDNYDYILDDIYEPYKIGELTFYASAILKELDPIAYRCGISDEKSFRFEDYKYELKRPNIVTVNGSDYETRDDEEEN